MNNQAARTARNRENATHSTGPKTEAGKQRSCLNAMRHGLNRPHHCPALRGSRRLPILHETILRRPQARRHPRATTRTIPRRHILAIEPHPRARK